MPLAIHWSLPSWRDLIHPSGTEIYVIEPDGGTGNKSYMPLASFPFKETNRWICVMCSLLKQVIPPEIVEETDGDSMKDQENHFYLSVLGYARLINALVRASRPSPAKPMWIKPMRIRLLSRCR